MAGKPVCPICDSKKGAFLCQTCINAQLYDDKKQELREQRDGLQQQLEVSLAKRVRSGPRRVGQNTRGALTTPRSGVVCAAFAMQRCRSPTRACAAVGEL
jgi:hypothetical protein